MNDQNDPDASAARLGHRLRTARRTSGLTLEQLADLANVSIPTISNAENGTRQPRLDTLHKLATALGISMGALLIDPTTSRQPPTPATPATSAAVPEAISPECPAGAPRRTNGGSGTGASTFDARYSSAGDET